jgi:hypothetical protein
MEQVHRNHIPTMPVLHLSALPSKESVVFESSSFFVHNAALPTPDEVRHAATHRVDPWKWFVVRFPFLRLIVKYGRQITIAEGQCLWAMRTLLGNTVPVPEVYGWYRDGDSTFLYMELIDAPTLKERWNTLLTSEKEEIGKQFGQMVENIRRLELPPSLSFVGAHSLDSIVIIRVCLDNCDYLGHIGGQPIQDVIFRGSCLPCPGPFPDVSSFHNYFVKARTPNSEDLEPHEYRSLLPDSSPIKFTYGDLHPTNILVSPEGTSARIVAIIDWHQSGWLPEYWEFCKAVYSVYYDEWETYVRRALMEPEGYVGFEWFSLSLI